MPDPSHEKGKSSCMHGHACSFGYFLPFREVFEQALVIGKRQAGASSHLARGSGRLEERDLFPRRHRESFKLGCAVCHGTLRID